MKIAGHIRLVCVLLGLGATLLRAKDPSPNRIGDIASEDIVAPITLEVVDPVATAALKSSEAAKIPAIFRSGPDATNVLSAQLQTAFNDARSNFLSSLRDTFHQTTLDETAVASPDFGYLVTAFNIKNRDFPLPTALASDWAAGGRGAPEEKKLLHALLRSAQRHIRPDDLPASLGLGENLRLVPVKSRDEKLTLADAELRGQATSKSTLTTLAQARSVFRREFTGDDEQPLARALAAWLQPNCLPDVRLTQLARDHATGQLIVSEHYTAGQIIAPQGSVIDARVRAALDQLSESSTASLTAHAVATAPDLAFAITPPPVATDDSAQKVPVEMPAQPVNPPTRPLQNVLRHNRPVLALAIISILSAAIFIFAGIWQLVLRRRRSRVASATTDLSPEIFTAQQAELTPLVQAVREALVQELAVQRRDLLVVQQNAAADVARLVHRMDELQMALQERLRAYEQHIQKLETELAARTEENQELIKVKIEMIRQQVAAESTGKRLQFN